MRLKKLCVFLLAIVLCISTFQPQMCFAADTGTQNMRFSYFSFTGVNMDTEKKTNVSGEIMYYRYNPTSIEQEIKICSSNTDVVKITSEETVILPPMERQSQFKTITYQTLAAGIADIIVTVDGQTYQKRIFVLPDSVQIEDIQQTGYKQVTLRWNKVPGCTGYIVNRRKAYQEGAESEEVATVYEAEQTETTVDTELLVPYRYSVTAFIQDGQRRIMGTQISASKSFTTRKIKTEIESVSRSDGNQLTVQWKPLEGAVSYKLYRSTEENGEYNLVYETDAKTTSYTEGVSQGVTYYYKVKGVCPEGESDFSGSVSQYIPVQGKKKTKYAKKTKVEYSDIYQCSSKGKMYMVGERYNKRILDVYRITSKLKLGKRIKSIKIEKNAKMGCVYAGPDGNFYVALGYSNHKESRTKTVIKVIKYNSKWEKIGTASIKGSASNVFKGIYEPFDFGDCRMDLQGNTLIIHTARIMFKGSDGVRHQSNISFEINTETMAVKSVYGAPYVSHSFNRFVKFKDGNLYFLDLGDAYPRAATLRIQDDYDEIPYADSVTRKFVLLREQITKNLIEFKGKKGDNYTGCTLRGMEVGQKNVVICGIAQLNMMKGVSGFSRNMKQNIFIATCDRKTGETDIKWLLPDNSNTSSLYSSKLGMVKLSDNQFAVMYFAKHKGKKYKLHYLVVSDTGEIVYKKTYSGFSDIASANFAEPVLYQGSIIWTANIVSYFKKPEVVVYSIPAIVK